MDTGQKPRRKRLRLTLRAMMIVVLVIGGVLGWVVHRAHVQRDAVAAITMLRRGTQGTLSYDWQWVDGKFDKDARPRGPKWLRDALGPDVFDTVIHVTIQGDNVDDELLANVGKLHGVERFQIVGHNAPDLTPAGMAQIRTLSRLKHLSVRGFKDSHGFVAALKGKTGLQQIWLPEAAVTDEEMAIVGDFTDLDVLQVDGSNVTDRGFTHVANKTKLTILDMPGVRITDLAPVADLTQLDVLFLAPKRRAPPQSSPEGPKSLEPLRRLTKVTQMALGSTRIEDHELVVVAGLPKLHHFMIQGKGITEAGLARIAESRSLTSIWFTNTSIADLRPLSPRLHKISNLGIEDSPLTDAGLEALSGAARIGELKIAGTKITDAGLDHLASLPALWRLLLERSAITDAGLARLKPLKTLEDLTLIETRLTDSSVETLARFPALKKLRLDRSGISPAGVERLKTTLPKAQISDQSNGPF